MPKDNFERLKRKTESNLIGGVCVLYLLFALFAFGSLVLDGLSNTSMDTLSSSHVWLERYLKQTLLLTLIVAAVSSWPLDRVGWRIVSVTLLIVPWLFMLLILFDNMTDASNVEKCLTHSAVRETGYQAETDCDRFAGGLDTPIQYRLK